MANSRKAPTRTIYARNEALWVEAEILAEQQGYKSLSSYVEDAVKRQNDFVKGAKVENVPVSGRV